MDTRILIVADDRLVRAGLAALLADRPGYTVVGQVPSSGLGDFAWDLYRPDAVLWDLGWDPDPSLNLLADMDSGGVPIIALLPESHVGRAWERGVQGLLPRDVEPETLLAALFAVMRGLVVVATPFVRMVKAIAMPTHAGLAEPLTPRELDVLRLLADGLSNKAIAQRLGISEHTVKFHVNALMGKLGAQSRTEAVIRAVRLGLVSM